MAIRVLPTYEMRILGQRFPKLRARRKKRPDHDCLEVLVWKWFQFVNALRFLQLLKNAALAKQLEVLRSTYSPTL